METNEETAIMARPDDALQQSPETAQSAVAAQARALVEAQYVIARRYPRDWDDVRARILKACKRTSFALVARYSKPAGVKKIVGPSIRFTEEAARDMGNLRIDPMVVYDDSQKRIVKVVMTELERNIQYAKDVVIEKTVERSSGEHRIVLSSRQNTKGYTVYVVVATDDEVQTKEGALLSKAIRDLTLRILPGDIREEAMSQVIKTLKSQVESDPDAERKSLADAFADLNIDPSKLKSYLGHELEACTPSELADLRLDYVALKDGEMTWTDLVAQKAASSGAVVEEKAPAPGKKIEAIKEQVKKRVTVSGGDLPLLDTPVPVRDLPARPMSKDERVLERERVNPSPRIEDREPGAD